MIVNINIPENTQALYTALVKETQNLDHRNIINDIKSFDYIQLFKCLMTLNDISSPNTIVNTLSSSNN